MLKITRLLRKTPKLNVFRCFCDSKINPPKPESQINSEEKPSVNTDKNIEEKVVGQENTNNNSDQSNSDQSNSDQKDNSDYHKRLIFGTTTWLVSTYGLYKVLTNDYSKKSESETEVKDDQVLKEEIQELKESNKFLIKYIRHKRCN